MARTPAVHTLEYLRMHIEYEGKIIGSVYSVESMLPLVEAFQKEDSRYNPRVTFSLDEKFYSSIDYTDDILDEVFTLVMTSYDKHTVTRHRSTNFIFSSIVFPRDAQNLTGTIRQSAPKDEWPGE